MSSEFLHLTTRGRRTGRPHRIEIWFATAGGPLYLISGGGDRSDWVKNLQADPHATVELETKRFEITARAPMLHGSERSDAVALLHEKYRSQVSGTLASWQHDAFIVALDPEDTRA
jgi:deazaflavin-dependent oxidoreductase (nitroreductase family)